jgi:outer membrane protein insertion porin family
MGVTVPNPEALTSALNYHEGDLLNYHRLSSDINVIEKWYSDQGYILAKVVAASFIRSTQTLVYTLSEGKIHSVRFVGLGQVDQNIVQRLLQTRPGQILNATKLSEAREKILNTGFFSQVSLPRVVPSDEALGEVDVVIDVQERKINNVQVGFEQLQNNKLSLALSLKLPNFRNTGEGLYIKGQSILESNFKDYSYFIKYSDPWFLNTPVPFGFSLYQQVNQEAINTINAQSIKRVGWEANWDFDMGADFHYILAYKNEQINDVLGLYPVYSKNSLRHIVMNQTQLDLNNPLMGQRFYAEYERGGSLLGLDVGGIDFTRELVDYVIYWNTYKKDVLALHVGAGAVSFGNPSQIVFEQDRFSLGGAYSLRGYPDVYSGSQGGMIGNKKVVINAEYRMLLLDWFQLVLFADAGAATDLELTAVQFKVGRGIGFRVFSPIAPLRFDFALGDANEFLFHFALGQLF